MHASRCAPLCTFTAGQRVSQVVDCAHIDTSRPSLLAASSVAWIARSCAPGQRSGRVKHRLDCAQWARSWHVGEAAKEGTAGVEVRTIDTSPGRPGSQVGVDHARQKRADRRAPATIDVQLDGQIGSKKEGLQDDEGGRQDKRIVSVVSVFPADSGTCSADIGAEGHTNIGWQGKRNQGALFVSPCHAVTWRNL